jgi:endoglucanase
MNLLSRALLLLLATSPAHAADGFLRAQGKDIVDVHGDKVLLRGMGLGGWMLQEGYMLQVGNLGQQHVIRARIEELIGAEKTEAFYQAWLDHYVTKADIDAMADWGFDSVRLPMHYALFTPPIDEEPVAGEITWRESGFARVDELLRWTRANDMYLILDLHAAPGGQGNDLAISDRDPSKPSLWQSEANRAKTIALWRRLAERYKDEPGIGAYNLINEPNWGFADANDKHGCAERGNAPLRELSVAITRAIREVDPRHMIVIEGNCWGNNYHGLLPLWDDNLVISFHKYWNENTREAIATHLALREETKAPIWLGESGENSNVWFADAIALAESHDIGWAFWPLKKIGFNQPLEVRANPGYLALVEYWNGRGPKPSAEDAHAALMQLATHDVRFEHNLPHRDVIDAMLRQPHDATTRPFVPHRIGAQGGRIAAIDYDLGRHGRAYFDTDIANYHVSTGGERTLWTHGRTYRNDGVDIEADADGDGHHVTRTEAGEWLQYTLHDASGGRRVLSLSTAGTAAARVSVAINQGAAQVLDLAASGGEQAWRRSGEVAVELLPGNNVLTVRIERGGFRLSSIELGALQAVGPAKKETAR